MHALDQIEVEINRFLDNRYPTGVGFKVSIPEAEQDIRTEVTAIYEKYMPNSGLKPVVIIDENRVINVFTEPR